MRKIDFQLREESKAGKLFIELEYMGGDADVEIFEYKELKNITWDNYQSKLEEIKKEVSQWKTIENIDTESNYENVVEEYGEEIANMWENGPNDPTVDYQWKCELRDIALIAYDDKSNKYESYL